VTVACDFLLRRAGELVTMADRATLGVVRDGALAARDGRVVWVGKEEDLDGAVDPVDGAVEVDAEGACVLPGFVDCHTHLVWAGDRADEYARRLAGASYLEIQATGGGIMSTVRATRAATTEELAALARCRLDSFLRHGTTTVEAKSGYGLTLADEAKQLRAAAVPHPVRRRRTLLAAHAVPEEFAGRADEFVDLVCGEIVPLLAAEAEFVDVFCDEGAFTVAQARRVLETGRAHGLGLKIHAEELARSGGARLAAELGAVSADHLVHATAADAAALAAAGTVAVLLPGTSYFLRSAYAPARELLAAGATVALASDLNPGSCHCENLQLVVSLACQELRLTPAEALWAATAGGAQALNMAGEVGSLVPGRRCDLVVLDAARHEEVAYHFGVNHVDGVVVDGVVVVEGGRLTAAAAADSWSPYGGRRETA